MATGKRWCRATFVANRYRRKGWRLFQVPSAAQSCQGLAESDKLAEAEPDYCPHCGSLVEIRVSRGSGITRYKRVCTGLPPCRL